MKRATVLLAAGLVIVGCQSEPTAAQSAGTAKEEDSPGTSTPNQSQVAEAMLHVEGMVCQGCAEAAKSCLTGIDGVLDADVSLDDRSARVRYDASKTSPPAMVAALEAVDRGEAPSLQATVSSSGDSRSAELAR